MKIRGIFLADYVQVVRDTPELDWKKYLADSDWELVHGTVIPTEWYPVEIMAHIGRGIFDMRSKRNYELVRLHGRARANESFDPATKKFLLKDDPIASIKTYAGIASRYVDELTIKLEKSGSGMAEVSFYPVDGAPAWDLFREIQAGTLEQLVELNGGSNARAEFISEEREGREACIMRVTWNEDKQ